MVLIKSRDSIEAKIKFEYGTRKMIRDQEDCTGDNRRWHRTKGAQRGDFKFCDEGSKFLQDMKRFPRELDKISKEYHEFQKSQRKYGG